MISKKDLKKDYMVFGNKGNVWSNTAHIYKVGQGNLCGTPALSWNHAGDADMDAGCKECCKLYKEGK